MAYEVMIGGLATCATLLFVALSRGRKRAEGEPPYMKGAFLLGVAMQLAKDAVGFLRGVQKQAGDVVTLKLLYLNITFFLNPHDYEAILKSRDFDYHVVKETAVWRLFGAWTKDIKEHLKIVTKGVRGPAVERSLSHFSDKVASACRDLKAADTDDSKVEATGEESQQDGWKKDTVTAFTSKTMFSSLYNNFFDVNHGQQQNAFKAFKNFNVHRQFFNYLWLGVPKAFFPSARYAIQCLQQQPGPEELLKRRNIPEFLRNTITFMQQMGHNEADIKRNTTMMLYTNYNVNRIAVWALYYCARDERVRRALLSELEEYMRATGKTTLEPSDVEQLPILESVVQETTRLAGGALIVRKVMKDTVFESHDGTKHSLRKGDHVAMYPPLTHRDPDVFDSPNEFIFDRFVDAKFTKNGKELLHPVNALGSCPAKRFTHAHIKLFVISILHNFDLELVTDSDKVTYEFPDEVRLLSDDVTIRYRPKSDVTQPLFAVTSSSVNHEDGVTESVC